MGRRFETCRRHRGLLLTANLKHLALYGLGTSDRKSKVPCTPWIWHFWPQIERVSLALHEFDTSDRKSKVLHITCECVDWNALMFLTANHKHHLAKPEKLGSTPNWPQWEWRLRNVLLKIDWQQLCTLLSSDNVFNSIENRTDLDGGLLPPIA